MYHDGARVEAAELTGGSSEGTECVQLTFLANSDRGCESDS